MVVNITVPNLGESITEATVTKWYKEVGSYVNIDEIIVEIETDKITLEIPSKESGIINAILVTTNNTVKVGDIIGTIETKKIPNTEAPTKTPIPQNIKTQEIIEKPTKEIIFSPAAAKIAKEHNIETVNNRTGKRGRVTKADVITQLNNHVAPQQEHQLEERIKMTRLRKTIAQRLKESQNTAAILSTFNEVDMTEVMRLRKQYQESFKEKYNVKLGFMSFFIKAVVNILKEIPAVNAEINSDNIILKKYYHIGVAVGTKQGLVVPIIRDADKMTHAQIEQEIVHLSHKARTGKLSISDMTGGTFSITNGGIYGSLLSTPIINPPQSGILGMHNIVKKPIAIDDKILIRPMMYIALSYDHRIIDGKEAVTFLRRVKELVEDPGKLFFNL